MAYRIFCRSFGAHPLFPATYGLRHRLESVGTFVPENTTETRPGRGEQSDSLLAEFKFEFL